jgi:sterol desaturase/sphingolipid hydroxylase (fatty acid hydroxylase superfamily)
VAFLQNATSSLWAACFDLIAPAIIFAAVALAARGVVSLRAARSAASEVRTNLILFALDIMFVTPLLAIALGVTGAWIQSSGLVLALQWSALPPWAIALAAVFAGDFLAYWRHRLEHTALLWPGHAIHHSDTAMTWTTGLRFHPINRFSTALIDTSMLAVLGFPPWALIVNNLVRHYYGLFIHMDLPWTYGALGRLFVSPAMHRWHHVRDADGAGANFATVFSIFDQMFRTHYAPGPCTAALGVRDPLGPGAAAQLIWPFRVASTLLRRRFARATGAIGIVRADLLNSRSRFARPD